MSLTQDVILRTEGLTKEFRGFVAVNQVSLTVRRGTIHAVIGPNGAGKTTFFNLLTHFLEPTRGRIFYNGVNITGYRPHMIARMGLVRSFQISSVFPHLTARENVRVALQRRFLRDDAMLSSDASLAELHDYADTLLERVGLGEARMIPAVELPYGRKRALEIATTLGLDPVLMLLDEPTQGMGHEDVGRIASLVREVAANRTILMVEHNMSVVADLSDTITVLARGEILAEGPYAQVSADPRVIEAYMGSGVHAH